MYNFLNFLYIFIEYIYKIWVCNIGREKIYKNVRLIELLASN